MERFTAHSRILMLAEKLLQNRPGQFQRLSAELANEAHEMRSAVPVMQMAFANQKSDFKNVDRIFKRDIKSWSRIQPECVKSIKPLPPVIPPAPAAQPEPVSADVETAPVPKAGITDKPQKKTKRDSITPVIELAQSKCKDPLDTAEVWPHLQVLAQEEKPPFQGCFVEGLKYTKKGKTHYFTRDALRLRLNPELRAPRK